MMIDQETAELLEKLGDWHQHKVKQLQLILDNKDADMLIADIEIKAGSDIAKGLRIGVMLSLQYLGKLPFTIEGDGDA